MDLLYEQENILSQRINIKKKYQDYNNVVNKDETILREMFMCPKCTKSYRLKHSLTRHIKFECGKEPAYQCQQCNKKFKHKYDLNVHEKGKHLKIWVRKSKKNDAKPEMKFEM